MHSTDVHIIITQRIVHEVHISTQSDT